METEQGGNDGRRLLAVLDHAARSLQCARLSDAQFAEFSRLRETARHLCQEGKPAEAKTACDLALGIVKEGPPSLG